MALGAPDETGRRSPVDTGKTVELPADLVISAVGEGIETGLYEECGVKCDRKGRPVTDEGMAVLREDAEASGANRAPRVYAIGDARRGPATVVEAIADAAAAAASIAGVRFDAREGDNIAPDAEKYKAKKGILRKEARQPGSDGAAIAADSAAFVDDRCLGCPTICAVCADVCPNRANVAVKVPGLAREQIIHVDGLCNECGNCAVFCPYNGRPYMDKFTLFWSREDFDNSSNEGFLVRDGDILVRLDGAVNTYPVDSAMWTYPADDAVKAYPAENAGSGLGDADCGLPEDISRLIAAVLKDYGYLIH